MLYLIVSIALAIGFLMLFVATLNLITGLIKQINSQQDELINLATTIVELQNQLYDSEIEARAERNTIISKFNARLEKVEIEAIDRDNLTQSHLNRTIRQLNNGFHPEELDFSK